MVMLDNFSFVEAVRGKWREEEEDVSKDGLCGWIGCVDADRRDRMT